MAESEKIVRILFPDGHKRIFYHASIDTSVEGWLHVTRLEMHDAALSGITEPIAGYRLDALLGWESVEPDEQSHPSVDWFERGERAEHEGRGEDTKTDPSLTG